MECLVRDTGYRSESAEVDTAGRTFSLTVLLFNDTFRYVSFLRKRDISLLAVTVRERSANPVEFRSQQVRSGGEKKAFWCRAGCPSSSSKSVYSKHPYSHLSASGKWRRDFLFPAASPSEASSMNTEGALLWSQTCSQTHWKRIPYPN